MQLTLSPKRQRTQLTAVRQGDSLVLNGETFDFSDVANGEFLPASAITSTWFYDRSDTGYAVTREAGVLKIGLIVPYGAGAPTETLFPDPITASTDGPIALPAYGGA